MANQLKMPRIFFIHIPKVGGTSLQSFLRSLFDPSEICPSPESGIWNMTPADVRRYKLLMGHFNIDFVRAADERAIKLLVLRNPYDRIISLYDFWRSHTWEYIEKHLPPINGPRFSKLVTFEEFLLAGNQFIQQRVTNAATRQLLGNRYDELADNQENLAVEAFEVLKSLDWYGVSELFDESLRRLAALLHVSAPSETPRLNRTYEAAPAYGRERLHKTTLLCSERGIIAATNRADILLYNWGLNLFVAEAVCGGEPLPDSASMQPGNVLN